MASERTHIWRNSLQEDDRNWQAQVTSPTLVAFMRFSTWRDALRTIQGFQFPSADAIFIYKGAAREAERER